MKSLKRAFFFFASLRFAVLVISGLAISLAAGTILESYYDTRSASYFVYRSLWFKGLLVSFGLSIFCVAMSRYPWRKGHIPFLLAHAGILILLAGSWVTQKYGLDGSLRFKEGETSSSVEFEDEILAVGEGNSGEMIPVPWIPPVKEWQPFHLGAFGLVVDRFIPHAEPLVSFQPRDAADPEANAAPALRLKLSGGPMKANQEFWLWSGDPAWSSAPMGPARFTLLPRSLPGPSGLYSQGESVLELWITAKGELAYWSHSKRDEIQTGKFSPEKIVGSVIDPGWMGLKVSVLNYIPMAMNRSVYLPSKIQFGDRAPSSALRVKPEGANEQAAVWMGLGDQASFRVGKREIFVQYTNRRVILPFGIRLERFEVEHYEGTMNPSSYWSRVVVAGKDAPSTPITISMNEPLKFGGYTFYQASYIPEAPRPTTSILSVNYDPGRAWKYFGSILIVLGSILLFASKRVRGTKVLAKEKVQ